MRNRWEINYDLKNKKDQVQQAEKELEKHYDKKKRLPLTWLQEQGGVDNSSRQFREFRQRFQQDYQQAKKDLARKQQVAAELQDIMANGTSLSDHVKRQTIKIYEDERQKIQKELKKLLAQRKVVRQHRTTLSEQVSRLNRQLQQTEYHLRQREQTAITLGGRARDTNPLEAIEDYVRQLEKKRQQILTQLSDFSRTVKEETILSLDLREVQVSFLLQAKASTTKKEHGQLLPLSFHPVELGPSETVADLSKQLLEQAITHLTKSTLPLTGRGIERFQTQWKTISEVLKASFLTSCRNYWEKERDVFFQENPYLGGIALDDRNSMIQFSVSSVQGLFQARSDSLLLKHLIPLVKEEMGQQAEMYQTCRNIQIQLTQTRRTENTQQLQTLNVSITQARERAAVLGEVLQLLKEATGTGAQEDIQTRYTTATNALSEKIDRFEKGLQGKQHLRHLNQEYRTFQEEMFGYMEQTRREMEQEGKDLLHLTRQCQDLERNIARKQARIDLIKARKNQVITESESRMRILQTEHDEIEKREKLVQRRDQLQKEQKQLQKELKEKGQDRKTITEIEHLSERFAALVKRNWEARTYALAVYADYRPLPQQKYSTACQTTPEEIIFRQDLKDHTISKAEKKTAMQQAKDQRNNREGISLLKALEQTYTHISDKEQQQRDFQVSITSSRNLYEYGLETMRTVTKIAEGDKDIEKNFPDTNMKDAFYTVALYQKFDRLLHYSPETRKNIPESVKQFCPLDQPLATLSQANIEAKVNGYLALDQNPNMLPWEQYFSQCSPQFKNVYDNKGYGSALTYETVTSLYEILAAHKQRFLSDSTTHTTTLHIWSSQIEIREQKCQQQFDQCSTRLQQVQSELSQLTYDPQKDATTKAHIKAAMETLQIGRA